jgi:hypothetical protein
MVALQHDKLVDQTGPRTTGGALERSIAAVTPERPLAAGPITEVDPKKKVPNPCLASAKTVDAKYPDVNQISLAFRAPRTANHAVKSPVKLSTVVLFPIIPDGISGYTFDGKKVSELASTEQSKWCTQAFWERTVVYWFVIKILAFINWAATALAILLFLYAGVLYISGFASEANAKKAKQVIGAAITGLVIVILARVIVLGAVALVSDVDVGSATVEVPAAVDTGGAAK